MLMLFSVCWLLVLVPSSLTADCGSLSSCSDCQSRAGCAWCRDPGLNMTDRCSDSALAENTCSQEMIVDVESSVTVLEDRPLSPDSEENFVQISPQLVSVKLRPGRSVSVEFRVALAKQFPVDLYFLMDNSWSMRDSLKNLASLGGDIIAGIREKTGHLAIGFGSFIEKNVAPFTSGIPSFNCVEDEDCSPPYSFHHKASLAQISPEEFKKTVLGSPLAGNVDDPEGSLDALMQVMVCGERIGWRENSRKIIIVATDRDFHTAMDGKLAGILEPNDDPIRCELLNVDGCEQDGSGYYTHGEVLDYPSISHINSVAQQHNFLIIFAVREIYRDIYQALTQRIAGSHVDILSADGANIINIVEDKYDEITTSIQITDNSPADIDLQYSSDCRPPTRCSNVALGTPVTFSVSLTTDHCPSVEQENVTIFTRGLAENLTILVESGCECDCSAQDVESQSPQCNYHGFQSGCGDCQCQEGWFGRQCQCRGDSGLETLLSCQDEAGLVCSGRGQCVCGLCVCEADPEGRGSVSGSLCQCEDWTCPRVEEELCGGHGDCQCGACSCWPGWTGDSCSCTTSPATCISPYDGQICSGHGDCSCGSCYCGAVNTTGYQYSGQFCQINPAGDGVCGEVRDCVQCLAFSQADQQCDCSFTLEEREEEEMETQNYDQGSPCEGWNNNGCKFMFSVRLKEAGLEVVLHTRQASREFCPNLVTPLSIGAGALVFLIGIFSIIFYKCYIVIDSKREYARFIKQANAMNFPVNQNSSELYKSPITKFENPMFGK